MEPKNSAANVLIPLLDALNWQGGNSRILEAFMDQTDSMGTEDLLETMVNLNFRYQEINSFEWSTIDQRILPLLIVNDEKHSLLLSIENDYSLIFDGESGVYTKLETNKVKGQLYHFQYAEDMSESLIHQQNNWFSKLVYRFKKPLIIVATLTLLITLLDLLLPLFLILIYDRILSMNDLKPVFITLVGIVIYLVSSYYLSHLRASVLNYISTRMGWIISSQTFTRLVYLSPSYTETASINAQIARIKDFESLKNFVTNGGFLAVFNLIFSPIYIIAIIVIGGWIGVLPIINLIVLLLVGILMRPIHSIKMENLSETSFQRQQSLIEILKNTDEIKVSGSKNNWIDRIRKFDRANIMSSYKLFNFANTTTSISYFTSNITVLIMIYGGVLQVFDGRMSAGALIGILILSWKIMGPIQGAFGLLVQINGLKKSVFQINRFMKLPQDSNLKTNMIARNEIKGSVRFEEVSFRYNPTSNPALLNVSFTNDSGQILGISGHDGAGKTTILKLILGMYSPQAGRIIIDNSNIKQLEPLSLRKSISYSPEKDILFTGTIRDNFKSYNSGITDEKITELCDKTGLSKSLDLFAYTLDTELNEKVINEISVSLKKLFNITRMLARDSKLYLIDEPEDYLDSETLGQVLDVIKDLAKNKNANVILATKNDLVLEICDNVIQLNQGRINTKK